MNPSAQIIIIALAPCIASLVFWGAWAACEKLNDIVKNIVSERKCKNTVTFGELHNLKRSKNGARK
jgi:hypothetical protein